MPARHRCLVVAVTVTAAHAERADPPRIALFGVGGLALAERHGAGCARLARSAALRFRSVRDSRDESCHCLRD